MITSYTLNLTGPAQARFDCANLSTGGRKGWLLPSINRLSSLVDPDNPGGNPDLPPGHPFTGVQASNPYWSATTNTPDPKVALNVSFSNGLVDGDSKNEPALVWCVRGDQKSMTAY